MNGAELTVCALEAEGVDLIFGYPGGAIMPFYDALLGGTIRHILVRHEQAAALAANGYARASGKVGVCVATSGPGASNLVTGIADAMLDSVPMVVITGQVSTALMGTDAFQELDVFGMTMPIVKHSFLPRRVDELPEMMREAFRIARSGRPGPVLIDLPKDVQTAPADHLRPLAPAHVPRPAADDPADLERALQLMRNAQRPVVYGGGGIGMACAVGEFRAFAEATGIPTVLTLKGLGALPAGHPELLGMLGMHGARSANMAVQESDLLIVVGARFDDRATGKLAEFAPHAKVIHLDIDAAELGKLRRAEVALQGDLGRNLTALSAVRPAIEPWRAQCFERRTRYATRYDAPGRGVYAPALLRKLSELAPRDAIVSCDVGQHQMWVAQHCLFNHPTRHLSSGGLGTMGFGLPAGIGAHFAEPDTTVVVVSGDGSFMMNVQELATLVRYQVPVKIVLLDNQALGMVRQWQELFFARRYSEIDLSDNPDFAALARAFGVPGYSLSLREHGEDALRQLLAAPGPALLHVSIDTQANVWPLVPPNHSNASMMEPDTDELALSA